MAISANFYTFQKRKNSTLRPTGDGTAFNITIKYPCSVEAPRIELHANGLFNFNYCYIPYWSRYYFVESHTSIAAGVYELALSVDVAATYKQEITGQRVYAIYASADYDARLNDPRIAAIADNIYKPAEAAIDVFTGSNVYDYAMVISSNGVFNGLDLYSGSGVLRAYMQAISEPSSLEQIINSIGGADPFKAVTDAWRSPLSPSECYRATEGHSQSLWGFTVSGTRITDARLSQKAAQLAIDHSRETNDFRDGWTKYILYMPFGGVCEIDNDIMQAGEYIDIRYTGDPVSGMLAFNAFVHIANSAVDYPVAEWGVQLKTGIPIFTTQSRDFLAAFNAAQGVASIAMAGAKGGLMAAGVDALTQAATQYFDGMTMPPTYHTGQFAGSEAPFWSLTGNRYFRYYEIRYESKNPPSINNAIAGRPCQQPIYIGNAGFVQTSKASVAISGTDEERAALNNMLDGGLYYE